MQDWQVISLYSLVGILMYWQIIFWTKKPDEEYFLGFLASMMWPFTITLVAAVGLIFGVAKSARLLRRWALKD